MKLKPLWSLLNLHYQFTICDLFPGSSSSTNLTLKHKDIQFHTTIHKWENMALCKSVNYCISYPSLTRLPTSSS